MKVGAPVRTHCKRGHELTPDNSYCPPSRPEQRSCRICIRRRNAARFVHPFCDEHGATIASLRAEVASLRSELASARQQLRAQRRVIADLQAERVRLAARTVTHRRIVDGGVGGKRERRELRRAA